MSENHLHRAVVAEAHLAEAMDKLESHAEFVATRLRMKWRREEETWARGEELPPPEPVEDEVFEVAPPPMWEPPTMWERWRGYWHRF